MVSVFYEHHHHPDPGFPVIFRCDALSKSPAHAPLHWHESVELLFFIEGEGTVTSDSASIPFTAGDLMVVNSGCLHTVRTATSCRYYCLIPGAGLFGRELPIEEQWLQTRVRGDSEVSRLFLQLADTLQARAAYYQAAAKGAILCLFARLFGQHSVSARPSGKSKADHKRELAKQVISYLRRNQGAPVTVDQVCAHVGFSKSHVCHSFKEVTGQTVVEHLNLLRCAHARSLLAATGCTVAESAWESGFCNMSYFTRTYKRLMGELPSDVISNYTNRLRS